LLRTVASDERDRPLEYMTSVSHPQLVVFNTAPADTSGYGFDPVHRDGDSRVLEDINP